MTPKIIAFYLPQYHPTPDNDKWWGKGFTEWTNVGKAKRLFHNHYQPKVPADLGYYDLRLPEIRDAQAELAHEAGIYGFCYYHYWFGNGKMELERPFEEVLSSAKPDFPFMLCWANESWHRKFWNKDGRGVSKEVLVEQNYPGEEDIVKHFYYLLPAFKDKRYIRIDGRPVFMIYRPLDFKFVKLKSIWDDLAKKEGIPSPYFIAHLNTFNNNDYINPCFSEGYDAINIVHLGDLYRNDSFTIRCWRKFNSICLRKPFILNYGKHYKKLTSSVDLKENIYPTIIPNWDHTPRSGVNGMVLTNATPQNFKKHLFEIKKILSKKKNPIAFLKSWNEWGEGNYMEPDMKYGKGFIDTLRMTLDSMK